MVDFDWVSLKKEMKKKWKKKFCIGILRFLGKIKYVVWLNEYRYIIYNKKCVSWFDIVWDDCCGNWVEILL